ncbi:MAG: cytochrome c [Terriglobales bacterium]
MGKFMAGVLLSLAAIAAGLYFYLSRGYANLSAQPQPSALEQKLAISAMDASLERHAPKVKNPIPPTNANLIDGAKLYKNDCALCHGSPLNPVADVGQALYPRAPQFLKDAPDMPENQSFYIIKYGVRWTGMPAWGNILADSEVWKVALFLSRMEKLPSAVEREWKKPMTP